MTNPDKPGIVENWQVGDFAVCVNDGPIVCSCGRRHTCWGGKAKLGQVGTVAVLASSFALHPAGCPCPSMSLSDGTGGLLERFRKIRPDEHEACEEEFVTLLKRVTVTA